MDRTDQKLDNLQEQITKNSKEAKEARKDRKMIKENLQTVEKNLGDLKMEHEDLEISHLRQELERAALKISIQNFPESPQEQTFEEILQMFLLIILLLLASKLQQSLQQDFEHIRIPVSGKQRKEILDMHNFVRRNVDPTASNMQKMLWSEKISQQAENWAEKCPGMHSSREGVIQNEVALGENSYQGNFPAPWTFVMKEWYRTRISYKYGVGAIEPSKNIAPYIQMIWHSSRMVGCAVTYCPKNGFRFFHVCLYYPKGNIESKMATPYKKGLPCDDCPGACEDKLCVSKCNYVDNSSDCGHAVSVYGCRSPLMMQQCEASCKCATMTEPENANF
ncbi:hypothetical protein lerEdw1_018593 [Lerista edwardsae]|nr:hypothetical protein lerEdw1_018593 [Lerista edwardsae]